MTNARALGIIACLAMFAAMVWAFIVNPQPYGLYGLLWPFVAWILWDGREKSR